MNSDGQPSIVAVLLGIVFLADGLRMFVAGEVRGFGVGEAKWFIGGIECVVSVWIIILGIRGR